MDVLYRRLLESLNSAGDFLAIDPHLYTDIFKNVHQNEGEFETLRVPGVQQFLSRVQLFGTK